MTPLNHILSLLLYFATALSWGQDAFLDRFVEIKEGDHHFFIHRSEISAGEFDAFLQMLDGTEHRQGPLSTEAAALPALVSKQEADSYLAYMTDLYFAEIRLPTETEWQWAAKGAPAPQGQHNLMCVTCTAENALGVQGMLGNVWEWTSTPDPVDIDRYYVIKGGDYQEDPHSLSIATRYSVSLDMKDMLIGFRPVIGASDYKRLKALARADHLLAELFPEEHIELNARGIFDAENAHYFEDIPQGFAPVRVDEDTMELIFCCLAQTVPSQSDMDVPMVEWVGTVRPIDPDKITLARELAALVLQIQFKDDD